MEHCIVHVALGLVCCKKLQTTQILVTRRPDNTVLGGFWEFPGGKIEAGESPDLAVVRELKEEVGLQVKPTHALSVVEHVYDHAHVHLHPWLCRRVSGDVENLQVSEHKWVNVDAVSQINFPEANGPILSQLQAYDFTNW